MRIKLRLVVGHATRGFPACVDCRHRAQRRRTWIWPLSVSTSSCAFAWSGAAATMAFAPRFSAPFAVDLSRHPFLGFNEGGESMKKVSYTRDLECFR